MQPLRKPRSLALVLLVLLALSAASPAAADPPTRDFLPAPDVTLPADVCGFEVKLAFPFNKEYLTTFPPHDGQPLVQMITGAFKVTLTNLSSGKSLDRNISGISNLIFFDDGSSTVTGEGLNLLPSPFVPPALPGYPALFILSGHIVAHLDAAGNLISFTTAGNIEDMCAALSN